VAPHHDERAQRHAVTDHDDLLDAVLDLVTVKTTERLVDPLGDIESALSIGMRAQNLPPNRHCMS